LQQGLREIHSELLWRVSVEMSEWLELTFKSGITSWVGFPLALLAGLLASATSCCSAGVLGAIAGYSGTTVHRSRRDCLLNALCFMIGAVVAFMVLGAVAGCFGQLLVSSVGLYWKVFAALVLVTLGLFQLKWLPVKGIKLKLRAADAPSGILSFLLFGLLVGGIATGCDFTCNPIMAALLGLVLVRGEMAWGALLMLSFAIGYTLLPTGLLAGSGVGFQAARERLGRAVHFVPAIAGAGLILVGFYLLFSL